LKLLTIITVCFNSSSTIEDTLKSIEKIKNDKIEYIIIDGGSSDESLSIIEGYNDIVDILISEADNGIYDAMNKGLKLATGNWIAFLNSDDYYSQKSFIETFNYLKTMPDFDIVYGNIVRLSADERKPFCKSKPKLLKYLKKGMAVYHPSMFVKAICYKNYGAFSTEYKLASDYKFILNAYISGAKFKYIDSDITYFDTGGSTGKHIFKSWREAQNIQIELGESKLLALIYFYTLVLKRKLLTLFRTKI
jgi:glycosyltransferase involved in cell wall biosynthesis